MDLGLNGRRAVITGGSRGIGLSIALQLAAEGCEVALCARDQDGLEAALARVRELGVKAHGSAADVTDAEALAGFVEGSAAALGGIDFVVANCGGSSGGGLGEATGEDWAHTYALNVTHAALLLRAARPHLRPRSGAAAVFVSSISGWKPAPRAQYGSSKAALIYLAAALARELAEDQIRVNAVSPGSIWFPGGGWDNYQKTNPAGYDEFVRRDLPWGRLGSPEEVARVVALLLSPATSWVNGANVAVDGGQGRPSAGGW